MEDPEILTDRLRLRRLVAADAPDMYRYRSDPQVCRFQSFEPGSLPDVEEFIDGVRANAFDTAGTWFQFAICLRGSGQLIGDLGLHFMADDPSQVEIGFTVSPDRQGQGYGTEAVTGVLDHLLGPLGKHRVFASVDPRNKPSIALLDRVGMRQEAHFRQNLRFKGEWVDEMVFGILKSDWNNR